MLVYILAAAASQYLDQLFVLHMMGSEVDNSFMSSLGIW